MKQEPTVGSNSVWEKVGACVCVFGGGGGGNQTIVECLTAPWEYGTLDMNVAGDFYHKIPKLHISDSGPCDFTESHLANCDQNSWYLANVSIPY